MQFISATECSGSIVYFCIVIRYMKRDKTCGTCGWVLLTLNTVCPRSPNHKQITTYYPWHNLYMNLTFDGVFLSSYLTIPSYLTKEKVNF